ncbi:MAG: ParB N-terminal domain-containing protein [Planctomycetes bacterium]|nr:ParB N-terminal domain-containing protein [Planctomycetota bacterium]
MTAETEMVMQSEMKIEYWPVERFIYYANNPRKNDHAVDKMAAFIKEYGFRVPVIAKSDGLVVDGHLRLKAAKKLNFDSVPVVLAGGLSDIQIRALRIAVNKSAELAEWDTDLVNLELEALDLDGFDLDLTGFSVEDLSGYAEGGRDGVEGEDGTVPGDKYKEQYGVIILCESESKQEAVYNEILEQGYTCRVVTT